MQQLNNAGYGKKLTEIYLSEKMLRHFQRKILGVEQEALKIRIEEFLKFIILSTEIKGCPIPVSQEIDEVWHQWILETQEYHTLCQQLPSQRYIHHSSLPNNTTFPASHEEMENQIILDFSWIASYVANFGKFTEEAVVYWTTAFSLMQKMGWSLEYLNSFAQELIGYQNVRCNPTEFGKIQVSVA
ncbi:hypothetical protein [Nostoc sp. LEGE 06077]|uniref:hypothetical protein n=1 Tax=Nostoc sp. LEGE 06077 TaxID=915325 RepID=UPI001D139776|nr:hypothetical protein [Nostoc sp. LEGE 06077]